MILIALGSNLDSPFGPPDQTVQKARLRLKSRGIDIVNSSSLHRTRPVPDDGSQPWFINAVDQVRTHIPAAELLAELHDIEKEFGRVRKIKNEARTLDLDLLAYNNLVIHDGLVVPHPRMHEREFVLSPLCDFAPDWVHPFLNIRAVELLNQLQKTEAA